MRNKRHKEKIIQKKNIHFYYLAIVSQENKTITAFDKDVVFFSFSTCSTKISEHLLTLCKYFIVIFSLSTKPNKNICARKMWLFSKSSYKKRISHI